MTWIRRNWPDLLIVLFILALIAGFVVVLMGGAGSLFGNRNTSPSSTSSAEPTPPPASTQDPVAAAPGTEPAPAASQPDTAQPFPTPKPNSSTSASTPAAPAVATSSSSTTPNSVKPVKPDAVPVIPAQTVKPDSSTSGSGILETKPAATPTVETVPVRPAPRVEPTPAQPVARPSGDTAPVQSAPRVETAPARPAPTLPETKPAVRTPRVQASGSGIPTKSDYRISAGLYSSSAAAEAVANKIRGLGYPVHVVPSKDDTEVVLVGPFGNRSDANAASGDISRVHQNLFVYAPSSDSASSTASSNDNSNDSTAPSTSTAGDPNSSTASGSSSTGSGSSTAPSSGPASDSPVSGTLYLQVGAFGSQSSADTLMGKLRSSGYSPRTRIGSSGLVRVVVGPFAAAEIDAAKSKLSSEGVESFTVRSK